MGIEAMTGNIVQVTPFMLVPDIGAAIAFMVDTLGFAVDFRMNDYAYVSREGAGLRIREAVRAIPSNPARGGSRTISTAATSMPSMPSTGPRWTRCRPAMSMDRPTSPTVSASCWCWRRMAI